MGNRGCSIRLLSSTEGTTMDWLLVLMLLPVFGLGIFAVAFYAKNIHGSKEKVSSWVDDVEEWLKNSLKDENKED
jgi:hypothetical protein